MLLHPLCLLEPARGEPPGTLIATELTPAVSYETHDLGQLVLELRNVGVLPCGSADLSGEGYPMTPHGRFLVAPFSSGNFNNRCFVRTQTLGMTALRRAVALFETEYEAVTLAYAILDYYQLHDAEIEVMRLITFENSLALWPRARCRTEDAIAALHLGDLRSPVFTNQDRHLGPTFITAG